MLACSVKLSVAFVAVAAVLAAGDPFAGTWKLNLAKSKFHPGPPPKSRVRKHEPQGAGMRTTTEGIDAEGKPELIWSVVTLDGKDFAIHGAPNYNAAALTLIDAYTWQGVLKRDGKQVGAVKLVVSGDGKVLTLTGHGTDAKGRPFHNVSIYEKQ